MFRFIAEKAYSLMTPSSIYDEERQLELKFWRVKLIVGFHLLVANIYIVTHLLGFNLNSESLKTFVIDKLIFDYQILAIIAYSYLMLQCLSWGWGLLEILNSKFHWWVYPKIKRLAYEIFAKPENGVNSVSEAFIEHFLESRMIIKTDKGLEWNEGRKGYDMIIKRAQLSFGIDESYYEFLKWLAFAEMLIFIFNRPDFFHGIVILGFACFFFLYTIWMPIKRLIGYLIERFNDKMNELVS